METNPARVVDPLVAQQGDRLVAQVGDPQAAEAPVEARSGDPQVVEGPVVVAQVGDPQIAEALVEGLVENQAVIHVSHFFSCNQMSINQKPAFAFSCISYHPEWNTQPNKSQRQS